MNIPHNVANVLDRLQQALDNGATPLVDPQELFDIADDAGVDFMDILDTGTLKCRPLTALTGIKSVAWSNDWGDPLARDLPPDSSRQELAQTYLDYCQRNRGFLFTVTGGGPIPAVCEISGKEDLCYQFLWVKLPAHDAELAQEPHHPTP